MKKLVLILCLLLLVTGCGKEKREPVDYGNEAQKIISTSSKKVKVYVFGKDGCPKCAAANEFFTDLAKDKDYKSKFDYNYIELYDEKWNPYDFGVEQLLFDVATYFGDEFTGTPYIVVGEKSFKGYAENFESGMKKEIKRCYEASKCNDRVKQMFNNELD